MKRQILALGIFVLLVVGACSVGWAQQVQGSFTGQVTDSSGAVIGGAQVTALDEPPASIAARLRFPLAQA